MDFSNQKRIRNTTYRLPSVVRVAGLFFALIGSLGIIFNPIAIIIPLLGITAFLYQRGMILDPANSRFKTYKGFPLIYLGDWTDMDRMEYVFMAKRTDNYNLYSLPNVKMKVKDTGYFVGFTSGDKKELFDFKKFKTMVQAEAAGRELSQFFDLKLLKSKNFN